MIACLDVHYTEGKATAAAVVFEAWQSTSIVSEYTAVTEHPRDYESGQFYLRELRPLLAVIREIIEPIEVLMIDAYCHLSSDLTPGLGAHLKNSIDSTASVVGVAKNRYRDTRHAIELCRGTSKRPLFVTSIGLDPQSAARHVASMAGASRIPLMIKAADRLCRNG